MTPLRRAFLLAAVGLAATSTAEPATDSQQTRGQRLGKALVAVAATGAASALATCSVHEARGAPALTVPIGALLGATAGGLGGLGVASSCRDGGLFLIGGGACTWFSVVGGFLVGAVAGLVSSAAGVGLLQPGDRWELTAVQGGITTAAALLFAVGTASR